MARPAFSLIEVMVACALLAVGMCAAVVLFPSAMRNYRVARGLTDMGMFAKSKLSEVKALRAYNDSSGKDGFIDWTVSFDNVTLENATMRRMTLKTRYSTATAGLNETFVTYVDE